MAKLLGYQYSIVYKPGKENHVADALSRQPDEFMAKFLALSQVHFSLLDSLRYENSTSTFFLTIYKDLEAGILNGEEYERMAYSYIKAGFCWIQVLKSFT